MGQFAWFCEKTRQFEVDANSLSQTPVDDIHAKRAILGRKRGQRYIQFSKGDITICIEKR
jgi:hypothetical protein